MRMGHGPRRAVVILWLWTALLSAIVLLPTFTNRGNSLVPLAVVALALLLYIYFHPGVRSARAAEAPGEPEEPGTTTPPRWSTWSRAGRPGGAGSGRFRERWSAAVPGSGGTAERNRPLARVLPAGKYRPPTAPGLTFREGVG